MVADNELRILIEAARVRGAVIRTNHDGGHDDPIKEVAVVSGIAAVGQGWMPPVMAAERLRSFLQASTSTEAVDKLFLELSQFTKAKTRRELRLIEALRGIATFPPTSNESVESLKSLAKQALAEVV